MEPIISVTGLTKIFRQEMKGTGFAGKMRSFFKPEYRQFIAVDRIDLTISEGEKVAFLGPNGAGKSTTIKMLTGIMHPTDGQVDVLGFNPAKDREKMVYHVGSVFGQTSRLWYHLTPADSFELFGRIFEVPREKLKSRIEFLVERFEVKDLMNISVRKLSLGQRMRCELVASLIHSPRVVFLDEPTIGLDIIAKQKLREIINEINRTEKTTIFLTSHDLGDVENICKRIIIINHGRILYDGNIKELRRDYIRRKSIRVKFVDGRGRFKPLDFMEIMKQKDTFVEFEIPNTKENLSQTFDLLTNQYEVEDITIEDPSIEEIIKEFY